MKEGISEAGACRAGEIRGVRKPARPKMNRPQGARQPLCGALLLIAAFRLEAHLALENKIRRSEQGDVLISVADFFEADA